MCQRDKGVNVPFSSLNGAEPAATEIPARVIIARLLAVHAASSGTELRAKSTLSTTEAWNNPQSDYTRRVAMQL